MKKFYQTTALVAGMLCMVNGTAAFAGSTSDMETIKHQVQELISQNQQLTQRIAEMEQGMKVHEAKITEAGEELSRQAELDEEHGVSNMISKYVTLSGAIEVEGGWGEAFEGGSSSSIDLATVELGFDSQVTDWASGHVLVLYEEGEDLTVDEAFISLGDLEQFPLYFVAGRMYVPFGNFETNMISDPLTLEIAESQETALQVGFEVAGMYGSIFAFNGDTNEGGGDSQIEQFGANVGFGIEQESFALDIGMGYMNSMGDSDGLSEILDEEEMLEADYVDGLSAYAIASIGPVSIICEYITALDDIGGREDNQPMAFNLETGYTFDMSGMESTVALAYQGTEDMGGYLPESRILASLGVGILEGTTLAFEYAHDEDYDENDGGTGEGADAFTAQLAYEF